MVSWPTYKQRWQFVIEGNSTQKRHCDYNQYRCSVLHLLHPLFFLIGQRTEAWKRFHLALLFCFTFLLDNRELTTQTKKRDNLYWICVRSAPRSIRANVFHVHPCTVSNGTCVAFTAAGALLLPRNKSKSKQLPSVQGGNTIRFSHPWKAFCLWVWMHGRMHFNHSRVQCHHWDRIGNGKIKTILHNTSRLAATSALTSRMTYCMHAIFSIDFCRLLITSCCYNKGALHNRPVHWCVPDATLNAGKTKVNKKHDFWYEAFVPFTAALHVSSEQLCRQS